MDTFGSLIDGNTEAVGSPTSHISYVTKKEWAKLHFVDDKGIETALNALQKPTLQMLTPYERANILQKIATLLIRDKEDLAHLITLEMGKPIKEARGEIDYTASYFTWLAEEAKRIYGKTVPSQFPDKRLFIHYEPIGPTAIITPWNFPIGMAGRKMASAFAAGCPVIIKPSPETPVSLLSLGKLCLEAGIPKEALHILIGDEVKIGEAFLNAPFIRKLSFTGSCEVGRLLYKGSAATLKKLTMELGGHAPLIVFDDADLDKAVDEAIISKFRQSGQTCICANRFFVQQGIYPTFLKRFTEKVSSMKVGDPFDETTHLSHAIHPLSHKKAEAHVADALKKGAKAHLGAKIGYEPEILTEITDDMLIFQEETFGPVAAITTFNSADEAIRRANQTPYGLAAYVFTEGLKQAEKICHALDFGIVGLNDSTPTTAQIPFGGVKDSGFGREGGPSGIYEYLKEKVISQKL